MSLPSKVAVLAVILIADLLFFRVYYPEIFEAVLQWLPWDNNLEKSVMIILGLFIAVLTSTAIIYVLVKSLQTEVNKVKGSKA